MKGSDMTLTQFCKQLAKVEGKWTSKRLRVVIDEQYFCPITAVYYAKTGKRVDLFDAQTVAWELGLDSRLARDIMIAADYTFKAVPYVKDALLKATQG